MLVKLKYFLKLIDTYFLVMGVQPLITTITNSSIKIKKLIVPNVIMILTSIGCGAGLIFINSSKISIFKQYAKYGIANAVFAINKKLVLCLVITIVCNRIIKIDLQLRLYRKNLQFLILLFKFECPDRMAQYRKVRNLIGTNLLKILHDLCSFCFMLFANSYSWAKSYSTVQNILLMGYLYFPGCYIVTSVSLFFCGNRMHNFYLGNLNRLLELKISHFNRTTSSHKLFSQQCYELSDFIDRISILYRKLIRMNGQWIALNALPVLAFYMDSFCTLAFRPFYLYTMFIKIRTDSVEEEDFIKMGISVFIIIVKFYHSTMIMSSCQQLINTVAETGNILHHVDINGIDGRIKESIKLFSVQLLQDPVTVSPFGLFQLDYGLWFTILASSVSYFIILVQFQNDL